jgi:hypothetical protein
VFTIHVLLDLFTLLCRDWSWHYCTFEIGFVLFKDVSYNFRITLQF